MLKQQESTVRERIAHDSHTHHTGFTSLTSLYARQTLERASTYAYRENTVFHAPGDPSSVLYIIHSGLVHLYNISAEGRKIVLGVLGAGDIFGHTAIIAATNHTVFAESITECEISKINRQDLNRLIMQEPAVALSLMQALIERVSLLERRLEEVAFQPMTIRLARLLLELSRAHGNGSLIDGFSHQILADMLGSHRETITQNLNHFKRERIVDLGRMRIKILNPEALESIINAYETNTLKAG